MLRYQEIEHTADIGVEIFGATLEALFENAGYALFDIIADITTVTPMVERIVQVSGDNVEALLINWLRELLYLFSIHRELYRRFEILSLQSAHEEETQTCSAFLTAKITGEALDVVKHQFHTEVKAVTYHQFAVSKENKSWKARVIFDV